MFMESELMMMMMMMMVIWAVVMVVLVWVWRTLDWVWWTPRRLERELRRQGLRGNRYRFLHGDLKETVRLTEEAQSRPLPLHCHDIAPYVLTLFHNAVKAYESNMKESEEEHEKSKNRGMTTEEVIEECKLFYFSGQETTAVLFTWTMVLLAMYPNWQTKAREEVLQVFGKNTPDMDGLNQLKIMTMILNEVLMLYPPVALVSRETYKTMEIGGITYPPGLGVHILLHFLLIQHDPEFWGEDAKEFKPERFAEGIAKASKVAGAFLPLVLVLACVFPKTLG